MWDLDVMLGQKPKRTKAGKFFKGMTPHNKGKRWEEWMSEEAQKKVRANLVHCGRKTIGGENKRAVIATDKDGNEYWFESVADAARKLKLCRRNVQHVADGQRNHCGGWRFRHTDTIQH